jgi:carbamate kinase
MRVVVALGGNALLELGDRSEADVQERRVARAAAALATLLRDHQVIIRYGNGPQVGLLAIESAGDPALRLPYPFDVLDAQTVAFALVAAVLVMTFVVGAHPVIAGGQVAGRPDWRGACGRMSIRRRWASRGAGRCRLPAPR